MSEPERTCPACGAALPAGGGDCGACATRIVGNEESAALARCEACGASLPGDGLPCESCEATQVAPGVPGAAPDPGPREAIRSLPSELDERYEVIESLGRGAMGRVDLAKDRRLGRLVAIKRIIRDKAIDPGFGQRFLREATALAKFEHPNIVRIIDMGEDSVGAYILMEYVQGESLEHLLRRTGPLPLARAAGIAGQLLGALVTLHEQGIVHRDIKPLNVVIKRTELGERPVLIDFGLAHDATDDGLTRSGDAMGTPAYMAPEQWVDSSTVDGRADLYAIGALLYRMLTGDKPAEILPEKIPEAARALTLQLLERDRRQRPESARQALSLLETIAVGNAPPIPADDTVALQGGARPSPIDEAQLRSDLSAAMPARETMSTDSCATCAAGLAGEYLTCPTCGDGRGYCSEACFEKHGGEEHCSHCGTSLPDRYTYSPELDAATGQNLRFCGSDCRRQSARARLCASCSRVLPAEAWRADDIDRAVGVAERFCSEACVGEFRSARLCAACSSELPDTFLRCTSCSGETRCCNESCFQQHASSAHD